MTRTDKILAIITIILIFVIALNPNYNNTNKPNYSTALLKVAAKRIHDQKERIKSDSINLYTKQIEFTEQLNNIQIKRRNDRKLYEAELSSIRLVNDSDYISRNDSLYRYLQGSR
jgi:hypothetical protein